MSHETSHRDHGGDPGDPGELADAGESRGALKTALGRLGRHTVGSIRTLGIVLSLIILYVYFFITEESFRGLGTIQIMASQMVIVSLGAIGMTVVIISKGIDLSVGSVIALSMMVTAWLISYLTGTDVGMSLGAALPLAAIAGMLTGAVCGLVNGLLITGFRLIPFIATLGMMSIARGLTKLISTEAINVDATGWSHSWLAMLTHNPLPPGREPLPGFPSLPSWLLLAPAVWMTIVLAIGMAVVLRWTVFGRHVFAIGSNEAAARLCGIRVERAKIVIYTLLGLFAGLAGVVFCSRQSQGDPTAAVAYELDIIAAVVIGGGSLNGGEGSILGSLVGAAIMVVLKNGLIMKNVGTPLQEVLIGVILIAAVVMDQLQHARER